MRPTPSDAVTETRLKEFPFLEQWFNRGDRFAIRGVPLGRITMATPHTITYRRLKRWRAWEWIYSRYEDLWLWR